MYHRTIPALRPNLKRTDSPSILRLVPQFWSRGNGWAFAALYRAIDALPAGHPYALEFINKFKLMATALLPLQGADGLWRSSLLDADEYPGPESTGTGMYTAGLAYGVRTGLLPRATYAPAVSLAWQGLSTISQQPNGMVGYCQPVGASPAPFFANSSKCNLSSVRPRPLSHSP